MSITYTPRFNLPQWGDTLDPFSRSQMSAALLSLETLGAIGLQGLASARPAAGVARRMYLATDTGALSWDTGSAWVDITALAHVAASTNVHGLTGGAAVVGTTMAQALTNKTIDGALNTLSNIPWAAISGGPAKELEFVSKSASFTAALADNHKVHLASHGSTPIAITLPSDGAVPFPVGSTIPASREGAAEVYFVQGAGASVLGKPGLYLRDTPSLATAVKISSNTWRVWGDTKA